MISNQQLEQNLQQGEIAARERGLRGTCRALIGCGIATAALFWGFVIVAFFLPADETAANYDAIAVVLAVLFLVLAGVSIATIVLGIVYGVKCRRFARLKKQYARRMQGISGGAAVSALLAASAPQTKDAVQPVAPSTPASQENGTQAMQEALPARTEVLQHAPAQPVQPTQPAQSVFAPQRTERAQTYSALPQVSPLPAPQPPVKRRSRYWLWGIAAAFVLLRTYINQYGLTTPRSIIARWAPPTENDTAAYLAAGPHQTEQLTVPAPREEWGSFTAWYPADLPQSDAQYPAVVMVNGTGVYASKYPAVFEHLASWGFIVVGNEDPSTCTGASADALLAWLLNENATPASLLYGRVDTANIGLCGHSQGGVGVFNAVNEQPRGGLYRCAVSLSPTDRDLAEALPAILAELTE